jgi:cytochrome c556
MRASTRTAIAIALAFGAAGAPARGADDSVHIEYRQKVMKGIGADMGAISDIVKNGLPFTAQIAIHADKIGTAADLIGPAFEKRVVDGPTDAKPAIWEAAEGEKWDQAIADMRTAAAGLEDAAVGGDAEAIRAAVKGLGSACGDCHDPFRKPKEESYKRQ